MPDETHEAARSEPAEPDGAVASPAEPSPAEPPSAEPPPAELDGAAAAKPASPFAKLTAKLPADLPDIVIVVALLALFGLVHRFVQYVEFGGDAVAKWHFVRQWFWGNDVLHGKLDHHTGRMGVNLLTGLVQAIFGRNWRAYYIAPFFVAMLQVPFIYLIGKRLLNRCAGVIAVLIYTYLETVHRSASQLLPDGYAGTYAVIAAYLFLRFAEAPETKKRPLLIGLAAVAFGGYLAKETFVFFYPGLVLSIWLVRRNLRDLALFLGILLGGLLFETGLYAALTNYSSRYAAIRGTHGAAGNWPVVTFESMVEQRFSEMTNVWKYLMFFSLAAALWQIALHQHKAQQGRGVALIGVSQIFLLTFMVKSVNPIRLWQSFDPRYIDPFTPFAALMTGCLLAATLERGWLALPKLGFIERYGPQASPGHAAVFTLACLAVPALYTWRDQREHPPRDAFVLGARLAGLANTTYDRNLPLLQRRRQKAKDLAVMYNVYMSDKRLAKDGKLPDFDEAKRMEPDLNMIYIVKDPSVYSASVLKRLDRAGCVVEVSRNKRGYVLTPDTALSRECDDLLARATR